MPAGHAGARALPGRQAARRQHARGARSRSTKLKPDAVFNVPGVPDWMAIDEHVWVSNSPKHTVSAARSQDQHGPRDDHGRQGTRAPGWPPDSAACGCRTAATRPCRASSLKDGKVEATLPFDVAGHPKAGMATGAGSFWMMTDTKGTLARIDPATNKVVAEIYVAPGSYAVAFGENAVWVTSTEKSVLTRVNAAHQRDRGDDPGRTEAALPGSRRRRGVDDQPGGRLDLARRRRRPTRWSRRSRPASPAAAARSRSAKDRCG